MAVGTKNSVIVAVVLLSPMIEEVVGIIDKAAMVMAIQLNVAMAVTIQIMALR